MDKLLSIGGLIKDICNDIVSPYKNSTVNDVLKDDKINNNVEKGAKIFVVASGNIVINTIISSIDLIKYCIINANTLYKNSSDNIETINKAASNMMNYIKYSELFNNLKLDAYEDIKKRTLSSINENDESEDEDNEYEVKDNEDEDNKDEVKDNEDEDNKDEEKVEVKKNVKIPYRHPHKKLLFEAWMQSPEWNEEGYEVDEEEREKLKMKFKIVNQDKNNNKCNCEERPLEKEEKEEEEEEVEVEQEENSHVYRKSMTDFLLDQEYFKGSLSMEEHDEDNEVENNEQEIFATSVEVDESNL
jgi:hypothetical protein